MTRRLFVKLFSATIVSLSIGLPLGQKEIKLGWYQSDGEQIIKDIKETIDRLSRDKYFAEYVLWSK